MHRFVSNFTIYFSDLYVVQSVSTSTWSTAIRRVSSYDCHCFSSIQLEHVKHELSLCSWPFCLTHSIISWFLWPMDLQLHRQFNLGTHNFSQCFKMHIRKLNCVTSSSSGTTYYYWQYSWCDQPAGAILTVSQYCQGSSFIMKYYSGERCLLCNARSFDIS